MSPRRYAWLVTKLGYTPEWPAEIVQVPAMPTTVGAGTEDAFVVVARTESVIFGGPSRTRTMSEVLSGNLAVRTVVDRYIALLSARKPSSIEASALAPCPRPT